MKLQRWTSCAMGLSVALTLSAVGARAQDTSQVRIPVRKGNSTATVGGSRQTGTTSTTATGITTRESGGDVATLTMLRIDSLENVTAEYKTRLDALEAANAAAASKNAALEARINALADSLATANTALAALREELNATNTLSTVDSRTSTSGTIVSDIARCSATAGSTSDWARERVSRPERCETSATRLRRC